MRYPFIEAEKVNYGIVLLCRVMQVSTSGYYAWLKRETSERKKRDVELTAKIKDIHTAHRGRCGSPRIYQELKAQHETVNKKRVERLMREASLVGKHKKRFRKKTDTQHNRYVESNLLRQCFEAEAPNRIWTSDTTEVVTPTSKLYIAVILDLFARFIVGYAIGLCVEQALVLEAFRRAYARRTVTGKIIFHSDKGIEYASSDTHGTLKRCGFDISMSGTGNCFDNAVTEAVFARFKEEVGDRYPSIPHAMEEIRDYFGTYYNYQRRHSTNGYLTPFECEQYYRDYGRRPQGIDDLLQVSPTEYNKIFGCKKSPSRVIEI